MTKITPQARSAAREASNIELMGGTEWSAERLSAVEESRNDWLLFQIVELRQELETRETVEDLDSFVKANLGALAIVKPIREEESGMLSGFLREYQKTIHSEMGVESPGRSR
jgi:hypothetical protein